MPTSHIARALILSAATLLAVPPIYAADSTDSAAGEARVDALISQLTVDEKIKLLAGVDGFYTNDIPRLKIPRLKMSDGPMGTRNEGPSTAFPAGALLAATWDPAIAQREGEAIGRECRARGAHFILGPGMNIYRVPQNGRNGEYFGEDPLLAGQIAVGYIDGVQSQGVAACAKHYAANNQETERNNVDETIDERTLREIYLPAFEASVKQGHVASVMASYNKINGDWATANKFLETDVLKRDWQFDSLIMSDWGAVHDTLGPLNAGLDLEMPGPEFFNEKKIKPLLSDGKVTQATIDDKVRRLLRVAERMGWLDRPQKDPNIPLDDPQSDQAALDVAREGIVLLKNQASTLPLDRQKVHTIAVLGPNFDRFVTEQGSGRVEPIHFSTIEQGLNLVAGDNVKIVPIQYHGSLENLPATLAQRAVYDGELKVDYFDNDSLFGSPAVSKTESKIDHDWGWDLPQGITKHKFSARWTGKIKAPHDGEYRFTVRGDDGVRVMLDGKKILDDWSDHGQRSTQTKIALKAGESHDIVVEYFNAGQAAACYFGYEANEPLLSDAERDTVAHADAAVVCVGTYDGEGSDRPYELEADQQTLIQTVSAANPHTIVVLNSGGNVAMKEWVDKVPALIDGFYTGQAQGRALAEVIFGDVNPSGHLPDSFEQDWSQAPAYGHYPGQHRKVTYAEGIWVGYRWFDKKQIEPRFCFGHGLSYTTFDLKDLKVTPSGSGDQQTVNVAVTITNTGHRAGASVAQVYVKPPQDGGVERPIQELKGFTRVELEPGESKTVNVSLDRRAFSYWDESAHDWKAPAGKYGIVVGRSSRDIAARDAVDWK